MTIRINGQEVDIKTNTNIALTFRNSAFVSADKISNSYSNTITMPRTARNEAVFGCVLSPSSVNSKPYQYLRASIDSEGVQIVKDAIAYITEVTPEDYKVVIVWDTVAEIAQMVKEEKTLDKLDFGDDDFKTWTWENADANPAVFPQVHSGVLRLNGTRPDTATYHPAVSASDVLNRICAQYGLRADIGGLDISKWMIPIAKKEDVIISTKNTPASNIYEWEGENYINGTVERSILPEGSSLTLSAKIAGVGVGNMTRYVFLQGNSQHDRLQYFNPRYAGLKVKLKLKFFAVGTGVGYCDIRVSATWVDKQGGAHAGISQAIILPKKLTTQGDNIFVEYDGSVEFEVPSDVAEKSIILDGVTKIIPNYYFFLNTGNFRITTINPNEYARLEFSMPEVPYGGRYYITHNLPPIKVIDYVKALATLTGSYAVVKDGMLRYLSYEGNVLNKGNAVDWSIYLVGDYMKNMKFQHGEWARENKFLFKEKNGRTNSATFTIDNASLDAEKEYTVPFMAGGVYEGLLDIPLYEYEVGNAEPTYKGGSDDAYIAIPSEDGTKLVAPLDFKDLISNYDALQKVLAEMKTVTVRMKMPFFVIATLDMNRPIYLSQLGCYFAIITIKTSSNGECDVELLKI